MNIILMGPQGSGKGTQAELLSERLGLHIIEMGQILRDIAEEDTERGRFAAHVLREGLLFPSDFTFEALTERINKMNFHRNFLFDGYPRTVDQKQTFDEYLKKTGDKIDVVFYLKLDEATSIERLATRVKSKKTGHIYNLKTNPPPESEDPEDLIRRSDETKEATRVRLREYREKTTPLLTIYEEEGLLETIEASGTIEEVYKRIKNALKSRNLLKGRKEQKHGK